MGSVERPAGGSVAPPAVAWEPMAECIRQVMLEAGYAPVAPPVLQPAAPFLDRAGEDIRRRLYMVDDPGGVELCLRPDLTIPTCRLYLSEFAPGSQARLCYGGMAYRYQPASSGKPTEFPQFGMESLGAAESLEADAEVTGLAVAALRAAGLERFAIRMGDLSLFEALVDALDLPGGWGARLKRHVWRPTYFRQLLEVQERGGAAAVAAGLPVALAAMDLDGNQARRLVEDLLDRSGILPVGGRTVSEIAERILEQAADAAVTASPPASAIDLILRFLDVSAPARKAGEHIRALAASAGVSMDAALETLAQRLDRMEQLGVPMDAVEFSISFDRASDYYTGFVFQLWAVAGDVRGQLGSGGRYDRLLSVLGAPQPVPAVGCALRPDRIAVALAAQRGRAS